MLERGLHPSFFALLAVVDLHAPITPTALAEETGLRLTTLRDIVNGMVDNGHVRRVENPDDRRSYFLEITPEGRKFIAGAGAVLSEVERELEAELGYRLEDVRKSFRDVRRAARAALAKHDM
jgi:MarR family transcriptional regulator, transcriptional regulator for hemolysin